MRYRVTERQPVKNADQISRHTASIETIVAESMTAAAFARNASERYPAVLATPILIGDLERACAQLLEPLLEPGELSVGARIEVSHIAPTPVGARVVSHARFQEYAAPLFWFEVWSEDTGGKVGKGRIARAIVREADILARAEKLAR